MMHSRPGSPQQWSVHAEFTISHPGNDDPSNLPQTSTVQDENGVRMSYTWSSNVNARIAASGQGPISSSAYADPGRICGYQRGNLFFTATPPAKCPDAGANPHFLGVQDSGYGSDLLCSSSLASGSLPRRNPNERKCRSTCSIVLSTNIQTETTQGDGGGAACGRTGSLRCQTPAARRLDSNYHFYGCGDPWCHHSHLGDELSSLGRVSPVTTASEDLLKRTLPAHSPERVVRPGGPSQKKDASVQTVEMVDRCTSPFVKVGSVRRTTPTKSGDKVKLRRASELPRHSRTPVTAQPAPSGVPDGFNNSQTLVKQNPPHLRGLPQVDECKTEEDTTELAGSLKKPRTVHIDVYCTGTDMESNHNSSDSSETSAVPSPQTIFESKNVCISHRRADDGSLPRQLMEKFDIENARNLLLERNDTDTDLASTAYPSNISSYSTVNDFLSSLSSFTNSRVAQSISSYATLGDSTTNTSWKDTYSDINSILQSSSSIAPVDGNVFVRNSSLQSSTLGHPYSESLRRIRDMRRLSENRRIFQQKKMQGSKKTQGGYSKSKDSDSDASDDSEKGWTFIKTNENTLDRKETFRESTEGQKQLQTYSRNTAQLENGTDEEKCNVVDPSIKTPSTWEFPQESYDANLRSPFMLSPGQFTDQRRIALRFGSVVNMFKKPGHHIGPAKNPECLCEHCERHFKNLRLSNEYPGNN